MTPEEAADIVETVVDRWSPEQKRALRVVLDHAHAATVFEVDTGGPTREHLDRAIELCSSLPTPPPTDILIRHAKATRHHARAAGHDAKSRGPEYRRGHADGKLEQQATPAPGDLAGLVEVLDKAIGSALAKHRDANEITYPLHDVAVALRAHRCQSAPEIAERPVEIVTEDEVRALYEAKWPLSVDTENDVRDLLALAREIGLAFYRAPEPVAPPAVGDTVETAAELDALPVGTVVRDASNGVRVRVGVGRWRGTHGEMGAGADDGTVALPARVLDLGGER